MENIFQNVLQMSIYGSVAIIAVLILRRCFRKLPKRITCLFWLVPGLRLLCPLNFRTIFSVMNIAKLSGNAEENINKVTNAVPVALGVGPQTVPVAPAGERMPAPAFDLRMTLMYIWIAGMMVIVTYLAVKTMKMLKVLRPARKKADENCYESDAVDTSFVLGLFKPRIYMQAGLSEHEESYILLHERTHIRNRDHITRIIGVLTVCIHWFNPLVWVAFAKMCTDLEMRCDESVIERMGDGIKKEYCRSIVRHAMKRGEMHQGLYAAFAGNNYSGKEIKQRINNMVNYKKVSMIVAVIVVASVLGLTIALSSQAKGREETGDEQETVTVAAAGQEEAPAVVAGAIEESEDVPEGAPVSVPGNLLADMTEEEALANYGKEELVLPEDVQYSDEGRPYSKTYDFRTTPVLKALSELVEKDGYEICDPDIEYLDKEGNVQTGRELYVFNAYKEEGEECMLLNFYMVSEEYAKDSFNDMTEKDGIWNYVVFPGDDDGWHVIRVYDPETQVMMDASGTYNYDWESLFSELKK